MNYELRRIEDFLWEILPSGNKNMRVPAKVFLDKSMLEAVQKDRALEQLVNVASLPGIVSHALVMPDVHEGYGFPIGGVAATDLDNGVISPGGIGYDINCGVRLLKSNWHFKDFNRFLQDISHEMNRAVPSGVGRSGKLKLNSIELDDVLEKGCKWTEKQGYNEDNDLQHIESSGSLQAANPEKVSNLAKKRGADQLGTLGSGNHFVEINKISHIFDEDTARQFGLFEGQIVVQIHTGSRGLGHQVAGDYVKSILHASNKYGIELPDRELACAPNQSPEGQDYLAAMSAAANYAWANRQMITHNIRRSWKHFFRDSKEAQLSLLYDVAHNIGKIEKHMVNGKEQKLLVHRKGATRAFPPKHKELSEDFKYVGQPVLIPGSMGTCSYVLAGNDKSMEISFGTSCHGAGRTMSRTAARKKINAKELIDSLNKKGISIHAGSLKGVAEEAPDAYKDVNTVVDVVQAAGIARKVARLVPIAVIKG